MTYHIPRRTLGALILTFALAAPTAMFIGCEREVSHTEVDKTSSDGETTHKETTVTEHPDGTVTKTQEKETSTPQ